MIKRLLHGSMIILVLLFVGCQDKSISSNHQHTETITQRSLSHTLYFTGILQPQQTVMVTSPSDGVIEEILFHYGDSVKNNAPLFVIYSDKYQDDYKTALLQYVKAKSELSTNKTQYSESKFLHKNGLISDDELHNKETAYYNAWLGMVQADDNLKKFLRNLDINYKTLANLNLKNIDKVSKILQTTNGGVRLRIHAPIDGVALVPSSAKTNDNSVVAISKGDQVKQGALLLAMGALNGYSIPMEVSEFQVNTLKLNQAVTVTSNAVPEVTLYGVVASIDHQAHPSQNGQPVFTVTVVISTVNNKAASLLLHVGMSAKVAINVQSTPGLYIPMTAVSAKNNEAWVTMVDVASGKTRAVKIITAETTQDLVRIVSGLKVGDHILAPD